MILLIDNYDSFTYNLYHFLGELGAEVRVFLNDKITLEQIAELSPDKIVISPGPCTPKEAGISCAAIRRFAPRVPTLGVCLGHQCIAAAFGGRIVRAPEIMHGKLSDVFHNSETIYRSLKNPLAAMRYHSLVVEPASLPKELTVTAWTADNVIMGIRHRLYPLEGVQFHPESILTENGKGLLKNFLECY
ncbi:MAG TPA: aminodeoxychorismate/anthranilate synthase component II [Candidatus Binatia bacterium]